MLCISPPLVLILCVLGEQLVVTSAAENDPYKTLGVSRSASQSDIKKAYKHLAREWHPDKNKDPGAEDMFIKITKSYEILSNEERRANFDRYGQMEDNQPFGHSQQQQGFRSFHNSFYFDESFFHFPSDVLPDSHRRPYLIKVTSDWCFACIHIEPVWRESIQELEPLGVGIGIVDMGYERRLASQLGAHRTPSILGVVNGRVTFFHQAVVREYLRQFIEDLLPQRMVEKITDKNSQSFLNGWRSENKPSVLLFDQAPVFPLMYKLTAFAFRDYVRFGYVDQGEAFNTPLLRRFNINTYAPTMLLGMKRQIMDEFVSNNKFLRVPRLVNQQLFDELCPVKQFHRRRNVSPKYCVLLITGEDQAFVPGKQAFLDFAATNSKEVLRFAYVYQRQQQPLCQALLQNQAVLSSQVVILERRSPAGKVMYRSVIGGWNGSEEDKHRLYEQLELLQQDPAYLTSDATLPELNNEMAPMFLIQWLNAAYDYFLQIYDDILYSNCESGDDKPQKPKPRESPKAEEDQETSRPTTSSRPPKKDFVEVTELTDITYTSNLVRLRPGHINIVLVLSEASKNALLRKFAKEVFSFSGTQTLHFSFLNADKHRQWMPALLALMLDSSQGHSDDDEASDYTGYVLALNGYKKYFCLFRPVFTGDDASEASSSFDSSSSSSSSSRRKSRSRSRSLTRSRSHSREDGAGSKRPSSRATSLEVHHKLDRLGLWMERLMEGTLTHRRVHGWPSLDPTSGSAES
ncbi:hypothetical protein CRUP_031933 [Coryphaenoides rupestris]|nr:hypothetical protein CRUP_031933 [Coryphaenoides rupestris]